MSEREVPGRRPRGARRHHRVGRLLRFRRVARRPDEPAGHARRPALRPRTRACHRRHARPDGRVGDGSAPARSRRAAPGHGHWRRRNVIRGAWILDSSFFFLLAMLVCGLVGYYSTTLRQIALSLAVLWAVAVIGEWRRPIHSWPQLFLAGTFMSIAWGVGLLVRRPVVRAQTAEDRVVQLEADQAAAVERAAQRERQRIARELHDIIAHSVSMMTVQAGAVRRLLTPEQERERATLSRSKRPAARDGRDAPAGGPAQAGRRAGAGPAARADVPGRSGRQGVRRRPSGRDPRDRSASFRRPAST